jgi:hypothetical protein
MIRELRSRASFQSVEKYSGHGAPDCVLTGDIQHMEEVDYGSSVSIEVTLSARLADFKTGKVLWQDTESQTSRLDHRTVSGLVEEISRNLDTSVGHLVSSMESQVHGEVKAEP